MNDLIDRQAAIDAMKNMYHAAEKWGEEASDDVIKARAESCMASLIEMKLRIEQLPSAPPEIIRCKDCRWWDRRADGSPMGYCHACKHGHYSRHWEINIIRTYEENFFCADAEPKEEGEKDAAH